MVKRNSSERVSADSIVEPLDRWHADHRNFSRLLDLVQQEVDVFHQGRRPDYELLRSIIYYMRHYPDRFHHPREDVAFNRLVKHDGTLQLTCARRIQEHAVIAAAGEELLSCLDRIIAGVVIERSTLEAAAATYLIYYRHHLAAEERELIPRAVELLTAADWKAVSAIPTEPDPLFGTDSDERYRELRQQIAIMAEEAE